MDVQEYDSAAEEFRQALRLDPSATWNYSNLADALVADGRDDEATAALMSAFDNPAVTDDPRALSDLGWDFLSNDWLDEAEQAFFRSIEGGATFPDPWEGLADQRYAQGNIPAAIAELQAAIDIFPEYAPFYESSGYFYWELGDLEQAMVAFNNAIELDPSNSGVYGSLASLLVETDREAEARELIRRGLERYPNVPDSYVVAAQFYAGIGEVGEAISLFERVIEIEPEDGWLYAYLAQAYTELGDYERARQVLGDASARGFGDPWLEEFIGWIYIELGDCEQAIDHLERALSIDPSIESAEEGIRECGG